MIALGNPGGEPIAIERIDFAGDFAIAPEASTCGAALAAHQRCTIGVIFTPTAMGPRQGSMIVTDNAMNSPQVIGLDGTGIAGKIKIVPGTLEFGREAVGATSTTKSITLANPNQVPLKIDSVSVNGADFRETDNCAGVFAAGASCTISVTFAPSAARAGSAAVIIADDATGSPQKVKLRGTGTR